MPLIGRSCRCALVAQPTADAKRPGSGSWQGKPELLDDVTGPGGQP
jgi:hypothetical protein